MRASAQALTEGQHHRSRRDGGTERGQEHPVGNPRSRVRHQQGHRAEDQQGAQRQVDLPRPARAASGSTTAGVTAITIAGDTSGRAACLAR